MFYNTEIALLLKRTEQYIFQQAQMIALLQEIRDSNSQIKQLLQQK